MNRSARHLDRLSLSVRPCVTVLLPCRNAGLFLREAVESVLQQPDCLELLVADGGSSDGSLQLLEELAAADPRVRLVSSSDRGPADALNKAFRAARGTLIGWLNADDLYPPGALARAVAALQAHPHWLMVYGDAQFIDAAGNSLGLYPTHPPGDHRAAFQQQCFLCQPAVVWRRSMSVLLGGFNAGLHTAFDFDFWLRAFQAFPGRIGFVPEIQACSRLHAATITASQRKQVALEAVQLLSHHLGSAEAHWIETYGAELLSGLCPPAEGLSVAEDFAQTLQQVKPWLGVEACQRLHQRFECQRRRQQQQLNGDWGDLSFRSLLSLLRPDLVSLFAEAPDADWKFWHWLEGGGWQEYQWALEDPQLRRGLHAWLDQQVGSQLPPVGRALQDRLASAKEHESWPAQPMEQRPFGVNLIGYVEGELGIGEDLRTTAAALDQAGVPLALINFPPGSGISQGDHTYSHRVQDDGPYAFNLFCLTAEEHARFLMERGSRQLQDRFNIGYWPWELSRWPGPWIPLFGLVDEIWASSLHTHQAIAAALPKANAPQLQLQPLAVSLDPPSSDPKAMQLPTAAERLQIRRHRGLPQQAVLFVFSFDLNSSIQRKNPLGVINAFQRAFPADDPLGEQVALVIKTHRPAVSDHRWQLIQRLVQHDLRLHLLEATLPRPELMALYAACDVFVSLHRAEGFGRNLAEALLLGLDVIATDHGGNVDFCLPPLAHLVESYPLALRSGDYPHHQGQHWGQPSEQAAAELMRTIAQRRLEADAVNDPSRDPAVLAAYQERFSVAAAGARYRARLEELWSHRHHLAEGLRWRSVQR